MSRLPHPISMTTLNNKRRLNSLLEIPFPANSHSQYHSWKKWLHEPLYYDDFHNKSWKRHHQITEWSKHLYQTLNTNSNIDFLVEYHDFRYFFSWWLFHSTEV